MDDKRNIILFTAIAALILFGWPFIQQTMFPPANPPVTVIEEGKEKALPVPEADPALDTPAAIREVGQVLTEGSRIPIATPRLTGSINLIGARIDDIVLSDYQQSIAADSPNIRLFSPAGTERSYYGSFGWTGKGIELPDSSTVWRAQGDRLAPGSPVMLRWDNATGQRFAITLSIDENYMITAKQTVANAGSAPVSVAPYGAVTRNGRPPEQSSWTIHIGPMGVFDGAAEYGFDYGDLDETGAAGESFDTTGGWVGFTDKYWLGAVIPDQSRSVDATIRSGGGDLYQANFRYDPEIVAAGESHSTTSYLFAGAKETGLLDDYEDSLGIEKLDRAIDWGWFYWFAKPIFYLLDWLFELFGNFGVAIIALTFIMRFFLFPIAQKQMRSMAQMRIIQPRQKAIMDKYKDDKPRAQQEVMALYKKEGVNPLAGCMPIFLQIPIFYALYKVLMLAVEMRHQPFALWIRDLSAPDPAMVLNLFGLLDFTPPAFLGIGVLAILLGVSMWAQFKLNPPPTDPVQKQVFGLMPWLMMFIMAPFAAGLLLYWITNNLLTIAQQRFLYSRIPELRAKPAT